MAIRTRSNHSFYLVLALLCLIVFLHLRSSQSEIVTYNPRSNADAQTRFDWSARQQHYPVESYEKLPRSDKRLPRVQHTFAAEGEVARLKREQRRDAIKEAMARCWSSYRQFAWMADELTPISGHYRSTFGGWAATLVDSLDTLWIMDMKDEFAEAVEATMAIDFTNTTSTTISLFETNIRYLGGLLAAHDLSKDKRLLYKAVELANTLYAAFDTPNRMPINAWRVQAAADNVTQIAEQTTLSAEIGSLSLEFTRLTQITGDPKWYDAIARITALFAEQQHLSNLPGMWPLSVQARLSDFSNGYTFSLGAMADSLYEYLPKMSALLGGSLMYEDMYAKAMDTAIRYLIFRPMLPGDADVLVAGEITAMGEDAISLQPHGQHLTCFTGGMFALGGRLIQNDSHVEIGRKLTDGCVWTYEHSPLGVMPESFYMVPCDDWSECHWNRTAWLDEVVAKSMTMEDDGEVLATKHRLGEGFTSIQDKKYDLRPEAIESVFINYRISGDVSLLDVGWQMWQSIDKITKTEYASSAIQDMTDPNAPQSDSMESFWLAETLKYFYLLYSPPSVISLDEYVFNTEAHPLLRPRSSWW